MRSVRPAFLLPIVALIGATPMLAQNTGTARMASMPGRAGRIQRDCGTMGDSTIRFRRSVGDSARSTMSQPPAGTPAVTGGTTRSHEYPEYDVVLDIPNLCVQNIHLKVDTVTAKVSLDAKVANLVRVSAGADVFIGDVDLTIRGVRAQALLLVDLDDVYHVVDRTLTFIDNHPEVVDQLGSTLQNTGAAVGGTIGTVLGSVNGLLLGSSRNAAGDVVQRLVDQATGKILERTLSSAGKTLAEKALGSVLDLPTLGETTNAAGNVVRRVRDSAGKVIEFTLDKATNAISNVKVQ